MHFRKLKTMSWAQLTFKLQKLIKTGKGFSVAAGYIRCQIKKRVK